MVDNRSNNVQKYLQYMSTIQALPSYKQILKKKNKHNLHTKKAQIHTLETVPSSCRVFNSAFVIQWLSTLLGGQNGQIFRFNRWKPRHWCGSENTTLKVGSNRTWPHVSGVRTLTRSPHPYYSIGHQCPCKDY